MAASETFELVTSSTINHRIYDDYEQLNDGHYQDLDTSLQKALRQQYPELALTVTIAGNGTPVL